MELVISIAFGIWFLIGAIFYGFFTKVNYKNNEKISKETEDKNK